MESAPIESLLKPKPAPEKKAAKQSFLRKWGSLVVMSLALAIIVIDTTLLNVSLRNIIQDLHSDIQSLQWVITSYSLILASLTITGGRLGDLFGKKKMFKLGAIIFAIGSFVASISSSFGSLLLGESMIEGIGAALMMPATASLLVENFHGRERAIAFGVWGGIAAAAAAIGPILGGYLTSNFSWRWGFRINVFVTIALLIGSVLVVDRHAKKANKSLDWLGVLLSSLGLFGIVFGIIESSSYGWFIAKAPFNFFGTTIDFGEISIVPISMVLGTIILIIFTFWELHIEKAGKTPLVSMKIFLNRQFSSGIVTTAILALGQSGIIFSIPTFLQTVKGFNAFDTGVALLPMSLALLIAAPVSAALSKNISPKRLIQIGLVINIFAIIVMYYSLHIDSTAWALAPGLALYGVGMGLGMAQISNLTLSAVPLAAAGEASGLNSTIRQIGASLGSALIGAALISSLTTNMVQAVEQSETIMPQLKPYVETTITQQTSNIEFSGGPQLRKGLPMSLTLEIIEIAKKAMTDANHTALKYTGFFALLSLLVSMNLPNKKQMEAPVENKSIGH